MPSDEEIMQTMASATAAFLKADWPQAARLYEQALKADPTNPAMEAVGRTYYSLALASMAYQESRSVEIRSLLDKALAEAKRAVRVFQQTSEPTDSVALAHQAIGQSISFMIAKEVIKRDEWPTLYPEGISALKKAIELDPKNTEAPRHLGIMYSAQRVAKMYGAKTGGCFIATATYGSPAAPEVLTFRQFRDRVLLSSELGAAAVRLYYLVSPPLANVISRHELLRAFTRQVVLEPILRLLKRRKEM